MTALHNRDVEQLFSKVGRFFARLPLKKTLEAGGQDLGDLAKTLIA
jgi:hypothetical protein